MKNCFSPEERKEKIEYLLGKESYDFDDLVLIVTLLRSEGGCPWDMEQTHKSLRKGFIEETYEVIEAIDTENPTLLREELGDVLLQIVFHADIEREEGRFDMWGVSNDICAKLIHRHPHVFGKVKVSDTAEVLSNWEKIKGVEKQRVTHTDKLRSIPPMLPALLRAQKVGKKASFFDFGTTEEVISKLYEELGEVKEAYAGGNAADIEEEIGDLLLTVTSLARKAKTDSELALTNATNKFIDRFDTLEQETLKRKLDIKNTPMEQLDRIWDEIKHKKS